MAKYFGKIGFAEQVENDPVNSPGVFTEEIVEREYYGDWIRVSRQLQGTDHLNDNINISNQLSIVSDPYAMSHFFSIRYATYSGVKWKVTNVDPEYPRLTLSLGGVYNG